MRGYRINQAQLNRLVDLATTQEALTILDSLPLLGVPYNVAQRQTVNDWPVAVTSGDVRKGNWPVK
jgi:hypothetical protein